ncbi:probable BOI-related E3 ubiquitin-protein ligase 2 [Tanacetum coccineum]|uniref:Probable BOI-related E3 ubiquitin-protein ligase 2 n=1 Tax=Tanacetum coccineum TaxID=301880 RepID=A0ABQ4YX46_9ASTR
MGFSNMPYMNGASVFEDQQQDQRIMSYEDNLVSSCVVSSSNSTRNGIFGFQNLSSDLERQGLEMDCFLHFQQNEKLKAVLNEETRRRETILMQTYESKMKAMLDAKDEVLTTATNRTQELQNYLLMAEKESKNWEKQALANEAMVNDLNKKLNQLARNKKHEEDAESICNGGHDHNDDGRHEKMGL